MYVYISLKKTLRVKASDNQEETIKTVVLRHTKSRKMILSRYVGTYVRTSIAIGITKTITYVRTYVVYYVIRTYIRIN